MKSYKYYLFYRKISIDEDNLPYAYTDSKKIAKLFMKQRDMSQFIYKSINLSKNDVSNLTREKTNNKLEVYEANTKFDNDKGYVTISLAITKCEELEISNICYSVMYSKLVLSSWLNPKVFSEYIQKYLSIINYDKYWGIFHNSKFDSFDDDLCSDFIGGFISRYKNMMKR